MGLSNSHGYNTCSAHQIHNDTLMKRFLTPLLMLLAFLTLTGLAHAGASLTLLPNKPQAPDFRLLDMDGNEHTLVAYRGKVVIINFWATWCPPCREELPSMNRGWAKIKGQGVVMLAVNVGEDEDTIFSFQGQYPIDFTILLDSSGNTINQWPIKGLPTTFVIDPQGRFVYRAIGGRDWGADYLLDKVRALRVIGK